ncbi:phage tail terminator-like protein [Pragia fontium]|uniref:phage tail terminator-like protein n=1 Tax=Pragia fontium TaxID=82985 RepID=UPI00064B1613|nr:phage tail terminator-like protein [Pragia fontium]AKJ41474.1 hypothetical protein QQ39_04750 [Pragia fontium]
MSTLRIVELLESHLRNWAQDKGLPICYENMPFNQPNSIYFCSRIIPAEITSADLAGEHEIYKGIYQIDVVIPLLSGKSEGLSLCDDIKVHFKKETELSDGVITCHISSIPSVLPPVLNHVAYTIPVTMSYRSDIV